MLLITIFSSLLALVAILKMVSDYRKISKLKRIIEEMNIDNRFARSQMKEAKIIQKRAYEEIQAATALLTKLPILSKDDLPKNYFN